MTENSNEQEKQEEQNIIDKLENKIHNELEQIMETEIQANNIDYFSKLVDMHKDIQNERYWNAKKEVYKMRYGDYGDYGTDGERGYGDIGYGSYGRRGVPGTGRGRRYRGYYGPEEKMEEMKMHYGAYAEGRQMGNYAAKQDSIKGLENMMTCITQCVGMVFEDATPEEKQIIQKHIRIMGDM